MSSRNVQTTLSAVKLAIFTLISIIVTGMLAIIMGHLTLGDQREYQAIFSTASELKSGDDVRIAGISVGSVSDVSLHDRGQAIVSFKVDANVPMTTQSGAEVRFLNLVGDRYLALTECPPDKGNCSGGTSLNNGATLPLANTKPALNLTALFNGFQPLFQALNPKDVNELALNIVQVLQGEGGTVQQLLTRTASLTNALADRDKLIGDVITNLGGTLDTIDQRHQQLDVLLVQLRSWMGNVARDRTTIGASLTNVSTLTQELADLITQARPFLKEDIMQLQRVMAELNKPAARKVLDETLRALPVMLKRQARIGSFGSWYNYYLCDFTGAIILPTSKTLLGTSDPTVDAVLGAIGKNLQGALNVYSNKPRCDG